MVLPTNRSNLLKIYRKLQTHHKFGYIFRLIKYPLQLVSFYLLGGQRRLYWEEWAKVTISCPDNAFLPRVANAGKVQGKYIIMHNGLKVILGSYAGEGMRALLHDNYGVHEPQEERVFMEVLKHLPDKACMMELGSSWAFYSMWFHKNTLSPTCYLIEPNNHYLLFGQDNFAANDMQGTFINGYIGKDFDDQAAIPTYTVDYLTQQHSIKQIHILHADIQGAELDMLCGANKCLTQQQIDYLFISTHSDQLHIECLNSIKQYGYRVIAEANVSESFSKDGVIVACRPQLSEPHSVPISKRK